MKVGGIELVPPQLRIPKLELMVEALSQLAPLAGLRIDRRKVSDSLGRSLEAHRQPGMPPGAFALFFPYGYLGLAIAAYNRVAGSKGKN